MNCYDLFGKQYKIGFNIGNDSNTQEQQAKTELKKDPIHSNYDFLFFHSVNQMETNLRPNKENQHCSPLLQGGFSQLPSIIKQSCESIFIVAAQAYTISTLKLQLLELS